MIYKFKFEVYNDDNENLAAYWSEESGNFWWAFRDFMHYVMTYAKGLGLK